MTADGSPVAGGVKAERIVALVRALCDYIDDVIGHGAEKLDYFKLIERDVGPHCMPLIWRIIDFEDEKESRRIITPEDEKSGARRRPE
jgi:hypothetical protein